MTDKLGDASGAARPSIRKNTLASAVSAAVISSALSGPAASQALEEVIVTATKRAESVQDVPLAITALSGDFINRVNLSNVKDLVTFTPGVSGNSQDSFIDTIAIRGIRTQDFGLGLDPSAAFFKNDLYEGRHGAAVTSLYDLDRAEILRGPQGFLFGRSSVAGAFSVHTRRAEIGSSDGYIEASAGERDHIGSEGAINIPVNDGYAMRLAGYYSKEDGFTRNFAGGDDLIEHDNWALRWSHTVETAKLGIYGMVEYEERDQSGSVYRPVEEGEVWETLEAALGPIPVRGSEEDADVDLGGGDNDDADILTLGLRVDYDLGFATLTSNTGYKDHDYFYNEDYDGTPQYFESYGVDQTGDYFQQELRLTSDNDGPFSWYAGLSYYQEDIEGDLRSAGTEDSFCQYYGYYYYAPMTFSGCQDYYDYIGYEWSPSANGLLEETGNFKGDYEGWGAYLNLAYNVTDNVQLEAGVRYEEDEKEFTAFVPTPDSELGAYWAWGYSTAESLTSTESWDDWTPRFIAKWTPTDTAMAYVSYTKGFKSGGFDTFTLSDNPDGVEAVEFGEPITRADGFRPEPVDPEEVDSYEIGYKDIVFDGAAKYDLVLFYYDYTDFQATVGTDSGATKIRNVGQVESWGVEGTITAALGDYFTGFLTIAYLDSEANDLQEACGLEDPNGCEGSRLYNAPEWSGSFVLTGNYPMDRGSITGNFELIWESERGRGWEDIPETEIDSYEEMALRIGWESNDNWFVEAYVENLTDEFTWDRSINLGNREPNVFAGPRRPRTYGMRLGYFWD